MSNANDLAFARRRVKDDVTNGQRLIILNRVLHLRDWHVCNLLTGNELFLVVLVVQGTVASTRKDVNYRPVEQKPPQL